MSTLSKSPLRVAREALAVALGVLPLYAHKYSPKKFTQPQLFACLILKAFLKTDYRGLAAHLADHSDLRAVWASRRSPTSPLPRRPVGDCYACQRLAACSAPPSTASSVVAGG